MHYESIHFVVQMQNKKKIKVKPDKFMNLYEQITLCKLKVTDSVEQSLIFFFASVG